MKNIFYPKIIKKDLRVQKSCNSSEPQASNYPSHMIKMISQVFTQNNPTNRKLGRETGTWKTLSNIMMLYTGGSETEINHT